MRRRPLRSKPNESFQRSARRCANIGGLFFFRRRGAALCMLAGCAVSRADDDSSHGWPGRARRLRRPGLVPRAGGAQVVRTGKGRGERTRGGRLGFAASPLLSRSCSPAPAGFGFCAARCGVDGGALPFAGVREARAGALQPESAAAANKGAAPCAGRLLRGESVVSSGCVSEPGLRARLPR